MKNIKIVKIKDTVTKKKLNNKKQKIEKTRKDSVIKTIAESNSL